MLTGMLLVMGGCEGGENYTFKGSEQETNKVVITNCVATPDSVIVKHKKQKFHWEVENDEATYIITFNEDNPTDDPPVVVSATLKDKDHMAHGAFLCKCGKYPYTMTKVTPGKSEICKDPGVHVVP
jgi:hypothetical protein